MKTKLSFDLNLVDLSVTGFWFCRSCQKITERIEREHGLPHCCKLCGSTRIKWNPPIFTNAPKPEISKMLTEPYRSNLDAAFETVHEIVCQTIQDPSDENFQALARGIAKANQNLTDLGELEQRQAPLVRLAPPAPRRARQERPQPRQLALL